jgi:hypothetical protein
MLGVNAEVVVLAVVMILTWYVVRGIWYVVQYTYTAEGGGGNFDFNY